MGCVSYVNSVVIVNGTPSSLFHATRDIRKGFSLSPLLFLLVIEVLSLLIHKSKHQRHIQGISFSPTLDLTNLHFVDDMILFGKATLEEENFQVQY